MPEDTTSETLPAGESEGTSSEGGQEAASNVNDNGIAKVLSEALGKQFKDDETALKSVKDTFDFVGAVGQLKPKLNEIKSKTGLSENEILARLEQVDQPSDSSASRQNNDEITSLKHEVEDMRFYKQNPELESYAPFLSKLRSTTGQSLGEIVGSEEFKSVLDKAIEGDKAASKKSVLESSPRLGRVRDKMTDARKAVKENPRAAAKLAVDAVLDVTERE